MRRVFLWAARNRWLKERLPRMRFMRRAVRRFMPGETLEDALAAALPLQAAGIGTMYTRLGENLEDLAAADEVAAHYIEVDRQDRRRRDRRRDLGQADPARARPRRRRLPRPPRPDRRACRRRRARTSGSTWRAAPTSRRRSPSTSGCARSSRGPGSASRRTCAGPPPTSSGCARSTRPSAWSRAPTTSRSRSPTRTAAASMRTTSGSPSGSCSTAAGGRSGSASGTHDVALIEQIAEQVGGGRDRARRRSRSRCCTASGRPAVPPGEGGLPGPGPHRLR